MTPTALTPLFLVALTAALPAQSNTDSPFPSATPESVGLSSERLRRITEELARWVEAGDPIGAEILIVKNRKTILHEVFGWRDREAELPWQRNTICRIRSMTKPFVGTAILMLVEQGKIALDDPLARYLPAFDHDRARDITIERALHHEGGFPQPGYAEPLDSYADLRTAVDAIGAAGPPVSPGERYEYSDSNSMALGAIVTQVSGMPVEAFLQQRIFEPLGLRDTLCMLTEDDPRRSRVSSTYARTDDGFEKYWDCTTQQELGFFRASGGIYSTTTDYARFLATWMDRGRFGDQRLVSEDTARRALTASPLSLAAGEAYGHHWGVFEVPPPGSDVLGVFGHSGSDGTLATADPANDLIVCYFTQSRRGTTLGRAGRLVRACLPETRSVAGAPLYRPELGAETLAAREADAAQATAAFRADPSDSDKLIWFGRRKAYLGNYREAVQIYTGGSALHPEDARMFRHRGHRYITLRKFDAAIADFERAVELIANQPDQVEPDGLPNARNIPTGTLHFNLWYHLGLTRYLVGDFEGAAQAYAECMAVSNNPDALCATTHWYYMTLRRLGRDDEAEALLQPIHADLDVIENHGYHHLLLMYKGERTPDDVLGGDKDDIQSATVAYGVAQWHHANGDTEQARALWQRIVEGPQWAAFGHIAAEVELWGR